MDEIKLVRSHFDAQAELQHAPALRAGFPSPAADYMKPPIDFNRDMVRNPDTSFYAEVMGDSMIDAGIQPGDWVLIDRSVEAADGDVIVAYVQEEFTIKYLNTQHRAEGFIELVPANSRFKPIRVYAGDNFLVWGVVVWVMHKMKKY